MNYFQYSRIGLEWKRSTHIVLQLHGRGLPLQFLQWIDFRTNKYANGQNRSITLLFVAFSSFSHELTPHKAFDRSTWKCRITLSPGAGKKYMAGFAITLHFMAWQLFSIGFLFADVYWTGVVPHILEKVFSSISPSNPAWMCRPNLLGQNIHSRYYLFSTADVILENMLLIFSDRTFSFFCQHQSEHFR